ncbi:MAG: hypothetical protein CL526_05280 [Aequorivita sp.]|nr:hypothetical protein [Aequorivita sp.]|tara:strand:+ start:40672 stop:41982 length:1311 start_codon:yes stop_codon:yes gene_type:complete
MSVENIIVFKEGGKYKFRCHLKSLSANQGFLMASPNYNEVEDFLNDFLSVFAEKDDRGNKIKRMQMLQKNTAQLQTDFDAFCKKYASRLPQLQSFYSFFNKTGNDNYFVIVPSEELTPQLSFDLNAYLNSLQGGKSFETLKEEIDNLYHFTLNNFFIGVAGVQRKNIGNPKKNERVCRFCTKMQPEVTFNQRAHAISEALGNKNVILFDECDSCNERFGQTIENDIIAYLAVFRSFYDVQGKGGKKKIKGKNFELSNDENVLIRFWDIADRPKKGDPYNMNLDFGQEVNFQNIYKALAKYFLSVIDSSQLKDFESTIEWINGNMVVESLPPIAELITYDFFAKQPKLFYFLRTIEDDSLPYAICDFHFTCKRMVYAIPFSSKDSKEVFDNFQWSNIFQKLKHFDNDAGWSFTDFSSDNKKNFVVHLNTEIAKNENF